MKSLTGRANSVLALVPAERLAVIYEVAQHREVPSNAAAGQRNGVQSDLTKLLISAYRQCVGIGALQLVKDTAPNDAEKVIRPAWGLNLLPMPQHF